MERKNILYIIDVLGRLGGAEKNLYTLATNLDRTKWNPTLYCLQKYDSHESMDSWSDGVISLNVRKIFSFQVIIQIAKLIKLILKENIEIIVSYFEGSDIVGLLLSKIAGVPIISNRRDMGYRLKKRHILSYQLINRFFDMIIVVSDAVKRKVIDEQNAPPARTHYIHNGVNLGAFSSETRPSTIKSSLGLNPSEPVVGMVGALRFIKGHKYFIEAASIILGENPNVQFLIVGHDLKEAGASQEQLTELSNRLGIKDKVMFIGERTDIPYILGAIDISVLSSLSEGFSNTILESMAAGKPVVTTNVGGNPEAVIHGETGLLVPPADSLALAMAIISLLKNRSLAKKMGEAGRERVESEFSLDKMISTNEELYEFVIVKHKIRWRIWVRQKWLRIKRFFTKGMKTSISAMLYYSGTINIYLWIRKLLGKSVVKLLGFHNISDTFPQYLGLSQRVNNFEKQIKFLKDNYDIVSLEQALELINKKRRFKNALVLTFDDCYKEFYTNVFPLIQKYKIPATFFLTVGPINSGIPLCVSLIIYAITNTKKLLLDLSDLGLKKYLLDTHCQKEEAIYELNEHLKKLGLKECQELIEEIYNRLQVNLEDVKQLNLALNWRDIKKMSNNGITFGSHTLTHPNLVEIPLQEALMEIKKSKEIIEQKTGSKVSFFAYPYGGRKNINSNIVKIVKSCGYQGAVTLIANPSNLDPFLLPRLLVDQEMSSGFLGGFSKSLFAIEISGLGNYVFSRFLRTKTK